MSYECAYNFRICIAKIYIYMDMIYIYIIIHIVFLSDAARTSVFEQLQLEASRLI